MSDVQHSSLLDEYLQKTAACQVATQSVNTQQHETLVLDSADGVVNFTQASNLASRWVLKDVHQALDEVLAAAASSPNQAVNRQTPAAAARYRQRTATLAGREQQVQEQQAEMPSSLRAGSANTSSCTPSKHQGAGLFRAMRQADAAALYAQHYKRDQEERGQQQQPVLAAPDDGANGAVGVIASNAALQAKLAKLQADMEARSYRQQLLQQLQQPGALFHQQQQQPRHSRQHHSHRHSNSMDVLAADADQPQSGAVFSGLLGNPGTLRPATSPALMRGLGLSSDPTAAYSNAATAANSRRNSVADSDRVLQQQRVSGTGSLSGTPSKLASAQQHQQQRLQHLKELADFELPWKPTVQTAPSSSSAAGSVYSMHVSRSQHERPRTSAGAAAAEPRQRHGSGRGSSGSSRLRGLAATPRRHSTMGGSRAASQQQEQQQQQHVQRPASAVAALQQSLSELAVFKSRVQLRQQEQEQQPAFLQQHGQQQGWRQSNLGHSGDAHRSSVPQQRSHSSTWLQDDGLQHMHEPHIHPHHYSYHLGPAAQAAAADGVGLLHGRAASTGGGYSHRDRRSSTAGYGLWDSWQEHVHSQAAAAADAGHGHRSSFGGGYGHSSLQRAQSVPRPLRAWDVLPLPSAASGSSSVRARRRSCSVSSPGKLTGHLQHLRQQQQEQRRPTTAGAAVGGMTQTGRGGSSVRPLGLHNSFDTYGAADAAAAAVGGSSVSKPHISSSSAWLVSSPLKRAQQLVAAGGRPRSSSGGGSSCAPAAGSFGGAAGRARSIAAVLSGVQVPVAAQQLHLSAGGSAGTADGRQLSRLAARSSAVGSAAAAAAAAQPGKAAFATAQLLQQVRAQRVSVGGGSSSTSYADRMAAVAARVSSGGGSLGGAAGSAPLTAQILEYAAGLHKPVKVKRRSSDSCSTSSRSSGTSDSSNVVPAAQDKQAAYAAALARVRAAKQANRRDESDDDSS